MAEDRWPELRDAVRQAVEASAEAPSELRPHLAAVLLQYLLKKPSADVPAAPAVGEARWTVNEAFENLARRSQPEQLVAILAYRLQVEGQDGLTKEDIGSAYRDARLPAPQNIFETIRRCVQRGWLTTGPSRDARRTWRITQTGLALARDWSSS